MDRLLDNLESSGDNVAGCGGTQKLGAATAFWELLGWPETGTALALVAELRRLRKIERLAQELELHTSIDKQAVTLSLKGFEELKAALK